MSNIAKRSGQKLCFVTIGATADFPDLLAGICSLDFIRALKRHQYTELRFQHGQGGSELFGRFIQQHGRRLSSGDALLEGILVKGFAFRSTGLSEDMRQAKGGRDEYDEGVIISHAGRIVLT